MKHKLFARIPLFSKSPPIAINPLVAFSVTRQTEDDRIAIGIEYLFYSHAQQFTYRLIMVSQIILQPNFLEDKVQGQAYWLFGRFHLLS